MAASDYRSCDVCGGKAFYDANLNYENGDNVDGEWVYPDTPYRVAGEDQGKYGSALDYVGDWAVICTDCAKTHRTAILPILPAAT
jgi:hypothetical protein